MLRSLSFIQFKGNVNEDDARDCFLEVQDWQGVNSNLFFVWNFKLHCLLSFFSFAVFCFVYLNVFGTLIYGFGVWMSLILCFVYLNVFGTLNSLIYGFGVWISLILDPSDSLLKHNILALCCFSFFFFLDIGKLKSQISLSYDWVLLYFLFGYQWIQILNSKF